MTALVQNHEDACQRIIQFQDAVSSADLKDRLSHARAWYAVKDADGDWVFGPSKYIGYESLTAKQYVAQSTELDGRKTEAQLRRWFTEVDPESKIGAKLSTKLSRFLSKHGKAPSALARISVLRSDLGEEEGDIEDRVIELVLAVDRLMSAKSQQKLRSRLGA
jgi:hypothetical protein